MTNRYKDILEDLTSRLNPEKAAFDAQELIDVSITMVRTLSGRRTMFDAEKNIELHHHAMCLAAVVNDLQTTADHPVIDVKAFLEKAERAFESHLEVYNHHGFPDISINKFLACHTRYRKCLDILKDEWDNELFVEEVKFYVETYVEMFRHHLKLKALAVTAQMRQRTKPGEDSS
jgi:hypothetical protein